VTPERSKRDSLIPKRKLKKKFVGSLNRGSSSKPKVTEADEAAFTLAKDEGLSPHEYLEAISALQKDGRWH
jgi:hypothetical protein